MSLRILLACIGLLGWGAGASSQELEPRRWNHLPTGTNFLAVGYAYTEGDVLLNPALEIEDATIEMHTVALKYIRTFEFFGKSARADLSAAYQDASWEGLLDGSLARANRRGWADPILRLAVNLFGAPPLKGAEFAKYRSAIESETIVGAGVAVHLPLGEYFDDKLINLGTNRFSVRPQLGVVHNRGKWGFELTGATWFFTENDDFFGGTSREQDPVLSIQGHVVYTLRPGLWLAGGVGYGYGGESTIDGDRKNDETSRLVFGASFGVPVTRNFGMKVGYLGTRTQNDTGLDSDSLVTGVSVLW